MENENKGCEIEKSFGLGVLLKLTQKTAKGIEISTQGSKFRSNVSLNELKNAVNATIEEHNIKLKIK